MTPEEIKTKAESFGGWYHRIELFPGYFTPLYRQDIAPQWDMVRRVRRELHYPGKTVLDIGTMDGMWAFEAEQLGARQVTTIDTWQGNYLQASERFKLAHEVLKSKSHFVEDSVESLRTVTADFNYTFDIIQFLGVLYHLENPILALRNARNAVHDGGVMLLETAVWTESGPPMARFNSDRGVYDDPTTFWAMNEACLIGALELTGWHPDLRELKRIRESAIAAGPTKRYCMLCYA